MLKETSDHRGRLEQWAEYWGLPTLASESDAELRARLRAHIERRVPPGRIAIAPPPQRRKPKLALLVLLIFVLLVLANIGRIASAEPCAWCPPAPCITDTSCAGCACLKVGGESTGVCVSR